MSNKKVIVIKITPERLMQAIERGAERAIRRVLGERKEKLRKAMLTTQEVCKVFKVSRTTIIFYQKVGVLFPASKSGRQNLYKRLDCEKVFKYRI